MEDNEECKEISLRPIGVIHTPFNKKEGMPIQGKFAKEIKGSVELLPEFKQGMKDLD